MAPDVPEPPHLPHRASTLPRWLEWTTAISALVISVCSIGIALYNARIEARLLKASSYPYVVTGFSDGPGDGADGAPRITVELLNNGAGPADERSLKIKLGDRYVSDVKDLIRTAVGPADADRAVEALGAVYDNEPTRFIASKDHGLVFRIDRTPANAREWDLLDQGMNNQHVDIQACYCSVFDECWAVSRATRKPVKACPRDPEHEFMPKRRAAASPLPPG